MNLHLYIQYSNNNPNDCVFINTVDLDTAITTFERFDWKSERKKVEDRLKVNLSSTNPGIILKHPDRKEELAILEESPFRYHVYYLIKGVRYFSICDTDFVEGEQKLSPHDFIKAFYDDKIELKTFGFQEENSLKHIIAGNYSPQESTFIFTWVGLLFLGISVISIVIFIITDWFDIASLFLGVFSALFGFATLYVINQYYRLPRVNKLTIDDDKAILKINYKNEESLIPLKSIVQCVYTYDERTTAGVASKLFNVVLTLNNGKQHFLTSLSFSKEEIERILGSLNINYYSFNTMIPFINKRKYDEEALTKGAKNKNPEMRTPELEESYDEASDSFLLEIVQNPEKYESEAVVIAQKVLNKRKIS